MGRRPATDEASTLTPLMFQILVALSQKELHGYAIMQEIEERTGGAFAIGAGSLYRSVKQLADAGLIEEVEGGQTRHSQRRSYRLTSSGQERVRAEAQVFHDIVCWARDAELLRPERA